jgi:hypothetical protein
MIIFFKSIINYDILGLEESFNGQKCIMWPKKSTKGKQEWMKACNTLKQNWHFATIVCN